MSSQTIHRYETATTRGGRIYGPDKFLNSIKNMKGELIDERGASERDSEGNLRNITLIYLIGSVAVRYQYSAGLGSFPNDKETIIIYGKKVDREELKSKLLRKLEQ